jgi:putative oxidoreductase
MKTKAVIIEFLIFFPTLLFIYTPFSKVFQWDQYVDSMMAQPLAVWFKTVLIYILPVVELGAVALMARSKTRTFGLYFTSCLLILFTGYTLLIKLHFFRKVPCTCAGVFRHMSWNEHLALNLAMLAITGAVLYLRRHDWPLHRDLQKDTEPMLTT